MILPPGTMISHYEILREIGHGGMGVVYQARDTRLNRIVALKFLRAQFRTDADRLAAEQEARTISSLNHPNIATIYGLEIAGGEPFLVFEYLPGGSLKERIGRSGPLPVGRALEIAVQITAGLAHAHACNVVHRDIKSDNILFDASGTAKIADFGLSRIRSPGTADGGSAGEGTVAYASPEQLQGHDTDQRSDIWSLGVVMYEMLTGRLPFPADVDAAVMYAVVTKEPAPATSVRPDVPPALAAVIDRCIEKDPGNRFGTASELLSGLRNIRGAPGGSRLTGPVRYWWAALCAGAGLLLYLFIPLKTPYADVPSVAVLYLKNLGPESDEPLCYGLTQDLIIDLGKAGRIRVAPMKDILRFRNSASGLKELARLLDVNNVLEGSVFRNDSLFRLSVQLVDVATQRTLWGNRFNMRMVELPSVQNEVAQSVLRACGVSAPPGNVEQPGMQVKYNAEAYEMYLQARYLFETKSSRDDVRRAEGLYEQAGVLDTSLVAAKIGLGELCAFTGDYDKALRNFTGGLSSAQRLRDRAGEASCDRGIGDLHAGRGEYDTALDHYFRALAIARETGDRSGEGNLLKSIGIVWWNRTRYEKALEYFTESLRIWQELGDRAGEARTLLSLGTVRWGMYDFRRALDDFQVSLGIASSTGDRELQGDLLNSIANVYEGRGEYQNALSYYERSLAIQLQLGNRRGEGRALCNIGLIYRNLGRYGPALVYFARSESIHTELKNKKNLGIVWNNMGLLYDEQGQYTLAEHYHRRSLDAARETGDRGAEAYRLMTLGVTALHRQRIDTAIGLFGESKRMFLGLEDTVSALTGSSWLAFGLMAAGDRGRARTEAVAAETLLVHAGIPDEPIVVKRNLARVLTWAGSPTEGGACLREAYEELLRRAGTITVDSLRRSYFDSVGIHREVLSMWNDRKENSL
ncbi:MAG TPA: tetratricopeptide repeat protein [Bacteroidota bacterium]|nr:tetratricopeptide repeat protein [Bacteroidota bacterium]